jgi:hypothetical protein
MEIESRRHDELPPRTRRGFGENQLPAASHDRATKVT